MQENVNPTRMELLKAKNRIKLAVKGHKLLKQKRDALILKFFDILKQAKDLRAELNALMGESFASLGMAEAVHGKFEIENAANSVKKVPEINVKVENVMGVKIPGVEAVDVKKSLDSRGYSIVGTSAKIDEAAGKFERALEMVIRLAQTENALKKLIREIEKTKRRVNALEFVLIPNLKMQAKVIAMRLDEMERETFFTLKMIKKKLA